VSAEIVTAPDEAPGFYGKLPARGDFILRRFGRVTVEAWDTWLQAGIEASREILAERWLDIYLTSPIWRFAIAAGCCGPNTLIGIVLPSVDKVGRYFPLMLGRELRPGIELSGLVARAAAWYRAAEELGLAALEPDFRLESLDEAMALDIGTPDDAMAATEPLPSPGLYLPLGADPRSAALRHAHQPLAEGRSLWWTSGSQHVAPCLLIGTGLPSATAFVSLLDGDWRRGEWLDPLGEEVIDVAPQSPPEGAPTDPVVKPIVAPVEEPVAAHTGDVSLPEATEANATAASAGETAAEPSGDITSPESESRSSP
jgi:type VI secretion system protein ImpM